MGVHKTKAYPEAGDSIVAPRCFPFGIPIDRGFNGGDGAVVCRLVQTGCGVRRHAIRRELD